MDFKSVTGRANWAFHSRPISVIEYTPRRTGLMKSARDRNMMAHLARSNARVALPEGSISAKASGLKSVRSTARSESSLRLTSALSPKTSDTDGTNAGHAGTEDLTG